LTPRAPDWRFVPTANGRRHPEYDDAWSLAEAMPLNATAPVTARDHFVVAFTAEELRDRIEQFRDLSISDDEIRRRYFTRTRSARYQLGDTRGWKLSQARRIVAADDQWQQEIIGCLYRPFDWRYVFWHPAMIDWPRTEVTQHLTEEGPSDGGTERQSEVAQSASLHPSVPPSLRLTLIARRQQLPTQPCTFFWIADCLALDGVIRSDNRGSESLFPLYMESGQANFAPAFVAQVQSANDLNWLSHGRGNLATTFGPEDLLAYIYALFHAPRYREKYADALRDDFPRLVPPRNSDQFIRLSQLGHELIGLHLLRAAHTASPSLPLSPSVSSFRAGGYVALRKWLQPKHRSPDDAHYRRMITAITRTVEIMTTIDQLVTKS
jgi:predicted helicase